MSQLLHQKHYLQVETKSRTSITSFSPERFILRENGKSAQGGTSRARIVRAAKSPVAGQSGRGRRGAAAAGREEKRGARRRLSAFPPHRRNCGF